MSETDEDLLERLRIYRRELMAHGFVTEYKTWTDEDARKLMRMSQPATLPKFEHKIIELRLYATEAELNQLGSEGWQLVSESLHEDQVRYVFCRVRGS